MPPSWDDVYQRSNREGDFPEENEDVPVEIEDRPATSEDARTRNQDKAAAVLLLRNGRLRRTLLWLSLGGGLVSGLLTATLFVAALSGGGRGYGVLLGATSMGMGAGVFAILHRVSKAIARAYGARQARRLAKENQVSEEALRTTLEILE